MFIDDLRSLNHQYFDILKSKIESGVITNSEGSNSQANLPAKVTIKDIQEKIRLFILNAKIFEKSMKLFTGLSKYNCFT